MDQITSYLVHAGWKLSEKSSAEQKGFDIYERYTLGFKNINRRRRRNWHSKGKAKKYNNWNMERIKKHVK
jgi:hypothetical protein